MSAKYLLPCHDGKTVEITTADAGRVIDCGCGKKVQVPTLRGVQDLPRADLADAKPSAPTWSAQQGAMFTIGLCLILVGLVAIAVNFNHWRQIDTKKPDLNTQALDEFEVAIETAEPFRTLDVWHALRTGKLGEERVELPWEANRAKAQEFAIYMAIAGTIAVAGVGLAIVGPLMRPAARVPQRRAPMPQKS